MGASGTTTRSEYYSQQIIRMDNQTRDRGTLPEEMVCGLWQRSTELMARSNWRVSCRLGQVEVTEGVVGNGDDGVLEVHADRQPTPPPPGMPPGSHSRPETWGHPLQSHNKG